MTSDDTYNTLAVLEESTALLVPTLPTEPLDVMRSLSVPSVVTLYQNQCLRLLLLYFLQKSYLQIHFHQKQPTPTPGYVPIAVESNYQNP